MVFYGIPLKFHELPWNSMQFMERELEVRGSPRKVLWTSMESTKIYKTRGEEAADRVHALPIAGGDMAQANALSLVTLMGIALSLPSIYVVHQSIGTTIGVCSPFGILPHEGKSRVFERESRSYSSVT